MVTDLRTAINALAMVVHRTYPQHPPVWFKPRAALWARRCGASRLAWSTVPFERSLLVRTKGMPKPAPNGPSGWGSFWHKGPMKKFRGLKVNGVGRLSKSILPAATGRAPGITGGGSRDGVY
jgi:hypothetical protein